MKRLFYFLIGTLYVTDIYSSPSDSTAPAEVYFNKAMKQELHAPIRQRYLDTALMFAPTNAYYWQQKAMPLYKQQKCEAGAPFLDSAVKYDPQRYLPYRAFMKCMFRRSYGEAIIDLNAAKQMDSVAYVMDHPFDFYLSICYLQLNELDKAERYIRKCIDERRKKFGKGLDHYTHFFYDGIVQLEKEHYAEAIKSFDIALAIYPHFSDAKYYKAKCYLYLEDREKALSVFREALADIQKGYTIAEDNIIHEPYPYQIKERWVTSFIDWMEGKKK